MSQQKKERKKKPQKELTHPNNSRSGKSHFFSNLMSTPEGRALRKQWSTKPRKNAGRPMGVPDGHSQESFAPVREEARVYADKVVKIMKKEFDIEDEYQTEALRTAVEVMRLDGQTREKLAAARLVLDFTKSKPAAKSDVTISAAEDFLASVMREIEDIDGSTEEDST